MMKEGKGKDLLDMAFPFVFIAFLGAAFAFPVWALTSFYGWGYRESSGACWALASVVSIMRLSWAVWDA